MVGLVAGDDLDLVGLAARLPVEARRLERRLVRLGAAGRQKDRLHGAAGEVQEALRQRDRRDVRRADEAGAVGQLLHLRRGRVRQLGAAVADVHVPQAGQPVDILAPVDVLNRWRRVPRT